MAKKGGMTKSEALQVRFDPIMRWSAEILAGKERRSLSSIIEWSVERTVKEIPVSEKRGEPVTAWQIADKCWHPDPVFRFYLFAKDYPELLTFQERNCWQAILFMSMLEQKLTPERDYSDIMDFESLPAMNKVWPYVTDNANNLDMVRLRDLYLEARQESP